MSPSATSEKIIPYVQKTKLILRPNNPTSKKPKSRKAEKPKSRKATIAIKKSIKIKI